LPILVLAVVLAVLYYLYLVFIAPLKKDREDLEKRDEDWGYGDDWKRGSPDAPASDDSIEYVTVLRGDTGSGYDDTLMIDLIGYLGTRGIRAAYDSFSIGLEPAAIKTYVLKVEAGKEDEAREYLKEFKS
jgi:hypothetical protein